MPWDVCLLLLRTVRFSSFPWARSFDVRRGWWMRECVVALCREKQASSRHGRLFFPCRLDDAEQNGVYQPLFRH